KIADKKTDLFQIQIQKTSEKKEVEEALFQLQSQRQKLTQLLEIEYPAYYRLKYDPDIPAVKEIQGELTAAEHMLDYFWGQNQLYVFQLEKDGLKLRALGETDTLLAQLLDLKRILSDPFQGASDEEFRADFEAFSQLSQALYDRLIPEIEWEGENETQRIKIIPDGALGYLNFSLLSRPTKKTPNGYKDLPYLLKDFDISYAYSPAQWWHLKQSEAPKLRGKDDLVAFRPSYPESEGKPQRSLVSRKGFGPLYYSKEEIENISQYFDTQIFEGEEATEKSFYQWASEFPLIQISAHAMIPDSASHAAFIAFTDVNSSQFDDSLMLEELYAQRIEAEMVVLSACETGLGKLYQGEGIMSLGRAFTYAGARSLLMSLWEVNDASTAQIMSDFYKYLAEGYHKDAAIRKAQLDYLAASGQLQAHPYFWAAFVANGDMAALEQEKGSSIFYIIFGIFVLALLGLVLWRLRYTNRPNKSVSPV
ncbi:MAG: CHAT domain-containing protein, partial [Bacteroidota bacterium]